MWCGWVTEVVWPCELEAHVAIVWLGIWKLEWERSTSLQLLYSFHHIVVIIQCQILSSCSSTGVDLRAIGPRRDVGEKVTHGHRMKENIYVTGLILGPG